MHIHMHAHIHIHIHTYMHALTMLRHIRTLSLCDTHTHTLHARVSSPPRLAAVYLVDSLARIALVVHTHKGTDQQRSDIGAYLYHAHTAYM